MQTSSSPSSRSPFLAALVICAAILQIAVSFLSSLGIGTPIGENSDRVSTLVTPAGWAFSIWGPLFLGAMIFAVYQARSAQRSDALLAGLRWPAAIAFLANASWATYVQLVDVTFFSVIIIFTGLGGALLALRRLSSWPHQLAKRQFWCAAVPLTSLAAWLTAAAIANISSSLRYHGVEADMATAPIVAGAVLIIGGLIAGAALARSKGCPPYALVFLWALAAIFADGGQRAPTVAAASGLAAVIVVASAAYGLRRSHGYWIG